jgi:hypothetical protein
MSDKTPSAPRFLVRQGCKGWMVYDRQQKGPALVGTNLAANLTKERADQIERMLTTESRGQRSDLSMHRTARSRCGRGSLKL